MLFLKSFLIAGDHLLGTFLPPPSHEKPIKEKVVVQELGDSGMEGSRKRRKSSGNTPTKLNEQMLNGSASPKLNGDVPTNGSIHGSPKLRKMNGTTNGIGSRGMLLVGK
jgi:hypothetical protein